VAFLCCKSNIVAHIFSLRNMRRVIREEKRLSERRRERERKLDVERKDAKIDYYIHSASLCGALGKIETRSLSQTNASKKTRPSVKFSLSPSPSLYSFSFPLFFLHQVVHARVYISNALAVHCHSKRTRDIFSTSGHRKTR